MKNHEISDGAISMWIAIFAIAVMIGAILLAVDARGQVDEVQAQWSYGGEEDVVGFRLFWRDFMGTYALGYQMSITDYQPPPAYMTIPVALDPGDYYFVVTAYDDADPSNESDYSNEASLHVQDTVKPGPCQGLMMRIPTP